MWKLELTLLGTAQPFVFDRLHAFELLLDSSRFATEPTVELNGLRRLCARGQPSFFSTEKCADPLRGQAFHLIPLTCGLYHIHCFWVPHRRTSGAGERRQGNEDESTMSVNLKGLASTTGNYINIFRTNSGARAGCHR